MIRVLQILEKLDVNSGVSAVVMNYYNHTDSNKVCFDFMVHEEPEQKIRSYIESRGSKIFVMPSLKMKNMFAYPKELREFFSKHTEYKIVHSHAPNAASFHLAAAKKAGVPIRILHSHNAKGADLWWKKIRNHFLNEIAVSKANNYCACSKKAAIYLFGEMKASKAVIVNNAIDTVQFQYDSDTRLEYRKKLGLGDEFVIGHVGRFCDQKNHLFLIELFDEVTKMIPNSRLLLVGSGPMEQEVKAKVRDLKLEDKVVFLGVSQEVNHYLQAMDLFVLPSKYEGLPVVCVEAQAAGLPCVVSDKITREVGLTDKVSYLDIDDPKEWADRIRAVWSEISDHKAQEDYQIDARSSSSEKVKDKGYDIRMEAEKLAKYYDSFSF